MTESDSQDEVVGSSLRACAETWPHGDGASGNNTGSTGARASGTYDTYRRATSYVRVDPVSSLQRHSQRSSSSSDEDSSDDEDEHPIPCSHELNLNNHKRAVTGLALAKGGARLATGSADGDVALWDFGGMTEDRLRPFKVIQPEDLHAQRIRSLSWSSGASERLLICRAGWQAEVLMRSGETLLCTPKGDPYLLDLKKTRGHVGELAGGEFNPKVESKFATWSSDSTVRVWNMDIACRSLAKDVSVMAHRGFGATSSARTRCSAASYSVGVAHGGDTLGAAYADGSLSFWRPEEAVHRPLAGSIAEAHTEEIVGISFSMNGYTVATRSQKELKLWDMRSLKQAISSNSHDLDLHPATTGSSDPIFSPNNQEVITSSWTPSQSPASVNDGTLYLQGQPSIAVFDTRTLAQVKSIPLASAASRLSWDARLNQVIVGHVDGRISILFDPPSQASQLEGLSTSSYSGAVLVVNRRHSKRRHIDDIGAVAMLRDHETMAGSSASVILDGDDTLEKYSRRQKQLRLAERGLSTTPMGATRPHLSSRRALGITPPPPLQSGTDADTDIDERRRAKFAEEDPREALLRYANGSNHRK
ncbi:hypothetical protein PYCC9005_000046 [Savitreella phatthalungensis]